MFESQHQSFDETSERAHSAFRLAALRAELEKIGLAGFVVPRSDRHQSEYVAPCDERLAWLTGFTGSAGMAVVLATEAAIFVDGRYTIAVRDQVDLAAVTPVALADQTPEAWIAAHLGANKLGYDPWLTTPGQTRRLETATEAAGGKLVAVKTNPIDAIWGKERPKPPQGKVVPYGPKLNGESASKKIARVRDALGKSDALLVSDPHSVAWLFNMRGSDIGYTPLALAFALLEKEGQPTIFIQAAKLDGRAQRWLGKTAHIADPSEIETVVRSLGKAKKTIAFDGATAPVRLTQLLEQAGGKAKVGPDPIALMKARKNPVELDHARDAHVRDGAAITRFLHWFATQAEIGITSEIQLAQRLEAFRRETGELKDLSFPTISAAGPHAAIPHYRVTHGSDRVLERGLYLVDSGAQYEDGTTDITRTLAVGRPSAEMRDRYTRVLKGHIAISRAVFPRGTTGAQIDALARMALWQVGLDFDHGTGHGVGAYLSVHEGPQRISKAGTVALEVGMILSNEPAYYKAGAYGIRIENLLIVENRHIPGAERDMLGFETITLAPYDRSLIDDRLLDPIERAWIDAYHSRVRRQLSPQLPNAVKRWLADATRKL